jgi:DNA-binding MarR family transcriptional regulator
MSIITNKGQFNFYPKQVWELKISHSAKLVLIALYAYADKNGYCYPSYKNLTDKTGYTRPIIAKSLKELESLELLRKETKFNNRYWLKNLTSLKNELVNIINSTSKETLPILVKKFNCNYTNELNHITNISPEAKTSADINKTTPTEIGEPKEKKHKYGEYKNVLLTDTQLKKLQDKFKGKTNEVIKNIDEGIEMKGYKYKDHYLAILKWNKENIEQEKTDYSAITSKFKIKKESNS